MGAATSQDCINICNSAESADPQANYFTQKVSHVT